MDKGNGAAFICGSFLGLHLGFAVGYIFVDSIDLVWPDAVYERIEGVRDWIYDRTPGHENPPPPPPTLRWRHAPAPA